MNVDPSVTRFFYTFSLCSCQYCRRAQNKVLVAEPLEAKGEAARNTKVPLPILLAALLLASSGSAVKTLFHAHLQYRHLCRLYTLRTHCLLYCDKTDIDFFEPSGQVVHNNYYNRKKISGIPTQLNYVPLPDPKIH